MTRRSHGFVVHVATLVVFIICGVPRAHSADAPTMDQSQWRDTILKLDTPHEGCFSAAYPETVWHATTCWPVSEHVHPVARTGAAEAAPNAGNGNDYTLSAPSLISSAVGSFPAVTGVTSETGTGVFGFYDEGILGPNEYSLQLNTNSTGRTAACASGLSDCTVWQQFIYSPGLETKGSAAVFIQYWLLNYGTTCPSGWYSAGDGRCFKDSGYVSAPDVAITSLGSLKLSATVKSGGNDTLTFYDGSAAYAVTAPDSVLDIATVWKQAEFNVFGNADGSQAVFNTGSSVTVKIAAQYGSTAAPSCVAGSGTASESNNLILQTCAAAGGYPVCRVDIGAAATGANGPEYGPREQMSACCREMESLGGCNLLSRVHRVATAGPASQSADGGVSHNHEHELDTPAVAWGRERVIRVGGGGRFPGCECLEFLYGWKRMDQ